MSWFTLKSGEKLYYEDKGQGPETLVMMHGWTSTHEVYLKPVETLQKQARCIIYDQRGHGLSKQANRPNPTMETLAGDLHELIQGLSLSNITLLGWSMGAGVIMNYISAYGCAALRQIILCDMSPKQMNETDWTLGLFQGRFTREYAERIAGKDFYELYQLFAVGAVPKLARLPDFLLRFVLRKKLAECDEKTALSLARSMLEADFRPCVEQITVPVHYFYAVPGSLFSPKLADWYGEKLHTPYHSAGFPNSTHLLISEHPRQFARAVIRVLGD